MPSERSTAPSRVTPYTRQRNRYILLSCIGLGICTAIIPVWWLQKRATQINPNEKFSKNMAVRGQYVNSSSTDVGPDPMAGQYIRRVYPAGKTVKSLADIQAEKQADQ
jgi:hypothetical protein